MSGRRIGRRTVLAGAAALALPGLPALSGCTRGRGRRLEIAVIWSDAELDRFRSVLDAYPQQVDVTSAGDDIDAFLRARHRAGNSPDIAMVSRPGLLPGYVADGLLVEIPETPELADRYPAEWRKLLEVDGKQYGVWIKAAHKSLFWHPPSAPWDPPTSWRNLLDQMDEMARRARRGGPAPLAIGAADGWVLTDWLENLLASRTDCRLYHGLSRGKPWWNRSDVADCFDDLFDLWSIPGLFPGGAGQALLTQNEESVVQVFAGHRALAVFEGDFVAAVIERFAAEGDPAPASFRFPSATGRTADQPLVVGGDVAVLLNPSDEARALLAWLTEPDTFTPWLRAGGFLTPNRQAHERAKRQGDYPHRRQQALGDDLQTTTGTLRFDLSDLLAGPLGGGDGLGSWRILQDFFAAATARHADRGAVVAATIAALDDAARSYTDTRGIDPRACG